MKEKGSISKWLYWFSLALAVIGVYKFLDSFTQIGAFVTNLIKILMPFIIGGLIAFILYIPSKNIEECYKKARFKFLRKHSRGVSILTIYLIVFLILFILVNVIMPPIIESITDLVSHLPGYYNSIINILNNLPEDSFWIKINAKDMVNNISKIDFGKYLSMENVTQYIKGVISVASGLFDLFVTFVVSIYLLRDRERMVNFLKKATSSIFKTETHEKISIYFEKANEIFFNFISGQLLDAVIVGIITTIAMLIMKVQYAALLGFIIGLFNLIPFFGAIVAVVVAVFITICTGGIGKAIWMAVVIIILQQIDANIINPKIIGDRLKISPVLVIFSVTFIGAYFGVLGMFLAVPIVAILKLITNDYFDCKAGNKK